MATATTAPPVEPAAAVALDEKAAAVSAPAPATTLSPPTEDLVKIRTSIAAEEASTGKKFVPFLAPQPGCEPAPPAPLNDSQSTKFSDVLEWVKGLTEIPKTSTDKTTTPLTDSEKLFLSRECILRYLRATKWDSAAAKKRIETTLVWRREYGVEGFTAEYIGPENETGKQVILGYDINSRPCLYLNPSKQNTERSERQIQHLVWMVERVVELAPAGQESLALLVNFGESTTSSNPSLSQGKQVLDILQSHYPERLGRALIINMPWFVKTFFKLISPFIDPLTREKLKFNEDLRQHVPPVQLLKGFGGDCDFEYDHNKYWLELDRLAKEKRAAYVKRWKEMGSPIGASEFELKGGVAPEVTPTESADAKLAEGMAKAEIKQ